MQFICRFLFIASLLKSGCNPVSCVTGKSLCACRHLYLDDTSRLKGYCLISADVKDYETVHNTMYNTKVPAYSCLGSSLRRLFRLWCVKSLKGNICFRIEFCLEVSCGRASGSRLMRTLGRNSTYNILNEILKFNYISMNYFDIFLNYFEREFIIGRQSSKIV